MMAYNDCPVFAVFLIREKKMRKKEMLSLAIAYTYSVKLGKETKVLSLKLNRDKKLKDRTHEWGVKLVWSTLKTTIMWSHTLSLTQSCYFLS